MPTIPFFVRIYIIHFICKKRQLYFIRERFLLSSNHGLTHNITLSGVLFAIKSLLSLPMAPLSAAKISRFISKYACSKLILFIERLYNLPFYITIITACYFFIRPFAAPPKPLTTVFPSAFGSLRLAAPLPLCGSSRR